MYTAYPITAHDFYKIDRHRQYPKGTETLYMNMTPRSGARAKFHAGWDNKVVFWGLQAAIIQYMIKDFNERFFHLPKSKAVKKYMRRKDTSLGPNNIGVEHIEALHDLGYLPVEIRALPEGSLVNIRVAMFTVRNTHFDFAWVPSMLEDILSCLVWKPTTAATIAKEFRILLNKYAVETGVSPEFVNWQGHDFSFRGMSGMDDAMMTGSGHLLSFTGTDTIPAIDFVEEYYDADPEKELIGGSVFATEHSVTTLHINNILRILKETGSYKDRTPEEAWGEGWENEDLRLIAELFYTDELITEIYPEGIVSNVSDTYDFWGNVTKILPRLKDKIMSRNGKYVVRPDSGDPVRMIAGYRWVEMLGYFDIEAVKTAKENGSEVICYGEKYYDIGVVLTDGCLSDEAEIPWYEAQGLVEVLAGIFGGAYNGSLYFELDPHIGDIYGDSITYARADEILARLKEKRYASNCVVFGIGSFTYEHVTRDTFGNAVKATYAVVDGVEIELYKDPKTDDGTKKSAKGLLRIEEENGHFVQYDQQTIEQSLEGKMERVFLDGVLTKKTKFSQARKTLHDAIAI